MKIKTFRGKIANATQEKINLHGGEQGVGYRIHKLQVISVSPGNSSEDLVVKIYKEKQSSVPSSGAEINFNEDGLLAAAHYSQATSYFSQDTTIVFDREVVNQDIFITHTDNDGTDPVNYYLELEEVKMSGAEQAAVNFSAAILHGR